MTDPMAAPIRIFRNGQWIDERDVMSSGTPPEASAQPPITEEWSPMPIPPLYTGVVDGSNNGVSQRLTAEGVLEAQAWVWCYTDTEERLESPVYRLRPEADVQQFDPTDPRTPVSTWQLSIEAAEARAARRAAARATMGPNDRSPLDMIQICRELQAEARGKERVWQKQVEAFEEQRRRDAADDEIYAAYERAKARRKGKQP